MATTPVNILQNVQLFIKSEIAWQRNLFWGIDNSNKSLVEFNDRPGNLGDTITFNRAPRFITYNGLVITQQPSQQEVQSLICSQAENVSVGYTDEQFIFNVRDYMDTFGEAAAISMGTFIEQDILKNIVSGVVGNNPKSTTNYLQPQINSGPYRYFGTGLQPINSYQQLSQAWANYVAYGAPKSKKRAVIPVDLVPSIVGSGLTQFAPARNDVLAKDWQLGSFAGLDVTWGVSNLLPQHISGFVQNAAAPNNVWTITAVDDPTGNNVRVITATEPTGSSSPNAVLAGDLFTISDGVVGQQNAHFVTFNGYAPTRLPVQFRAIANANTVAGVATIQIQTINGVGLVWAPNNHRNMTVPLNPGMQFSGPPSHQAGWMDAGNNFYLAMPKLPNQSPFETVYYKDPDSGAALRHYWGAQFGEDNRAYVRDSVWGSTLVAETCMRLVFPI